MSTQPVVAPKPAGTDDFMPLHGIDHVELWVGNAAQAAYFYVHALGFQRGRLRRPGDRRARPHLARARAGPHPARAHRRADARPRDRRATRPRHGDGVKVIALSVPDVEHAYRDGDRSAAPRASREPWEETDEHGTVRFAHDRRPTARRCTRSSSAADYHGPFLPGYAAARPRRAGDVGLLAIDHIVGNVELGAMETWVKFYEDVFGMTEMIHFSDEAISTEYSALMSKVVTNGNGRIKFPINEPAEGKRKSQIDEYLEFYGGAGAQHIAVATRDIVEHGRRSCASAGSSS